VSERTRILAVDDQPENLELLGAILEQEGYRVSFARDGADAIAAVERELPHAILLDLMMPRVDGLEVCRRLKARRPSCFVPIILLTALSDVESKVRGLDAGADDFLNKPFQRAELLTRLRSLLRIRGLRDELDSTESVIFSMVDLLEGKDPRTRNHSLQVAALARATADHLELAPRTRQELTWSALLHDLGKVGVPEEMLQDPDRDAASTAAYRSHPLLSARILEPIESLAPAVEILVAHHERLDGSGYPAALSGEQISRPAEILAIANLLDLLRRQPAETRSAPGEALRAEAAAGRFHAATVEAVLAAAANVVDEPRLDDVLPVPVVESGGTILVADDGATNRQLYRELLETAGYSVVTAEDGTAAVEALRRNRPDLLLLDVRMPGIAG